MGFPVRRIQMSQSRKSYPRQPWHGKFHTVIHRLRELPSNEGFFYRAPNEADKHSAKVAVKNFRFRANSEVACITQQDGTLMIVKTPMVVKKLEPWLVQDINSKIERTCGGKLRFQPFYIGKGIPQYSEEVENMRLNGTRYLQLVSKMNDNQSFLKPAKWTRGFSSHLSLSLESMMETVEDSLVPYRMRETILQRELLEF